METFIVTVKFANGGGTRLCVEARDGCDAQDIVIKKMLRYGKKAYEFAVDEVYTKEEWEEHFKQDFERKNGFEPQM